MPQLTRIKSKFRIIEFSDALKRHIHPSASEDEMQKATDDMLADMYPMWSDTHRHSYCASVIHMAMNGPQPIYHVPEEFFSVLCNVDPRGQTTFSTQDSFRFFSFRGDAIYCGGLLARVVYPDGVAVIFVYLETHDGKMTTILFKDLESWGEVIAESREYPDLDKNSQTCLIGLINAYLYVESENSITEILPPQPILNKTIKRKLQETNRPWNSGTVPAILVNWNFRHPRLRHVSETAVKGHFRWQPCGQGRAKRRLIWIDEHIRKYRNDTP